MTTAKNKGKESEMTVTEDENAIAAEQEQTTAEDSESIVTSAPTNLSFGSFFTRTPKGEITVPEVPVVVRNNCQVGRWCSGDTEYDNLREITIVGGANFYGDLGQTEDQRWFQLWFAPEPGNDKERILCVTYLKGPSLSEFNTLLADLKKDSEPASNIILPSYIKRSTQKPDPSDPKKMSAVNYYSVVWASKKRTEDASIKHYEAVMRMIQNPLNHERMVDLESTKRMICLDNLSPKQQQHAVAQFKIAKYGYVEMSPEMQHLMGSSEPQQALPPAVDVPSF